MQVTLLVDNLADGCFRSEHGLSLLVQTGSGSVLFDSGQSDAWVDNLGECGFGFLDIKAVALSHGHYDHTGGIPAVAQNLPGAKLFAHPACFEPKYAKSAEAMRYIGMPAESAVLEPEFALSRSVAEILPGVKLSGEIALRTANDFESRFLTSENGLQQDTFEDEQCMVMQNGDSVAVLVGCAHRGVENNVLTAMEIVGDDKIDLLIGGMHLQDAKEERLESLVGFLLDVDISRIVCCHCTGLNAYKYLRSRLGSKVTLGRAGVTWAV